MTAILKRKLAVAQNDKSGGQMTALRALRLSAARAAHDMLQLPVGIVGARHQRMRPDDMVSLLSDADLLIGLDCPGGARGAAALALPGVTALIQQQTMGVVSDRAPTTRGYTDTDAAMCAPLIEELLARACDLAEVERDKTCFSHIRFGARAEDQRSLLLSLRSRGYRIFWLTLDIALGKQQAELILVLPDPEAAAEDKETRETPPKRAPGSPMLDVPTQLDAVLQRVTLSVSDLNALSIGDTLPLQPEALKDTSLLSADGALVAQGQLGQINGFRAVRLVPVQAKDHTPVDPVGAAFDPLGDAADPVLPMPDFDADLAAMPGPALEGIPPVTEVDAAQLETLSTQEAAEQIGALAGLSMEDLASADPPAVEVGADMVPTALPPPEDGIGEGGFPMAPIDLGEPSG